MPDLSTVHPGNRFNLYRENDSTPGQWDFLCAADAHSHTITNAYNDTTRADCSTPTNVPLTSRSVSSRTEAIEFSGKIDLARRRLLTLDAKTEAGHRYQIRWDETGANGGGTVTGTVKFDSLRFGKSSPKGNVDFAVTGQFEGEAVWAAAA